MDVPGFPKRIEDMTPRAQRILKAVANVFYGGDIELAFASARQRFSRLNLNPAQQPTAESPEADVQLPFPQ
jgi:hypothetical protein